MYSETTEQSRSRTLRRIRVFLLLFVLSVGMAWGIASVVLRSAAVNFREELVREMSLQAQQRAAEANVWLSALTSRGMGLAEEDMVRLFVAETAESKDTTAKLAALANRPENLIVSSLPLEERALARRFLLMRGHLLEFMRQDDFVGVRLYAHDLTVLAGTSLPELNLDAAALELLRTQIQTTAGKALKDGTLQAMQIICDAAGRLVMPLYCPVFPPRYMREKGDTPLGVIELFCDVTEIITRLTAARDARRSGEAGRVLQRLPDGSMEEVRVTGEPPRALSAAWHAEDSLTEAERLLPDGAEVFALGVAVPGLPWIVAVDMEKDAAEAPYVAFRWQVVLFAAGGTLIIALLLASVWWWLVGRRERALAVEMGTLYQLVSRQKELLDGINGTLMDAIILRDPSGLILYVNTAFATMTGRTVADTIGRPLYSVLDNQALGTLLQHGNEVMRTDSPAFFLEELQFGGETRQFQVANSPYHDSAGGVIGVVSVFRDITDMVKAQRRAQMMITHTVRALVRAIEAVDPYLCGQAMRTGHLAAVLVARLGLGQEHVDTVRTAANLSQIGMIRLPRRLITKQGRLTPEERAQLECHVDYAREALQDIDFDLPILPAITQMYERLDGSGYPAHLRDAQICIDARVLGVASAFCAMLRPRSYRQARDVKETLEILTSPQFDQRVVATLRAYLATDEGRHFLAELAAEEG